MHNKYRTNNTTTNTYAHTKYILIQITSLINAYSINTTNNTQNNTWYIPTTNNKQPHYYIKHKTIILTQLHTHYIHYNKGSTNTYIPTTQLIQPKYTHIHA